MEVLGAGTTGSARHLSGIIVGADIVKNEITAHAVAALHVVPEVRTVLEIGGQDSKIIILQDGIVVDFAMNTVCAAGTGSFLDHQAARLDIPIEDFGDYALRAESGVQIAGRCSVFAESDMIHKQQVGHPMDSIIFGLCEALVRNYLNNLAKGKNIESPVVFQGGVAANVGMKRAFEEVLEVEVVVPDHFEVMGAIGAALLAQETERARHQLQGLPGHRDRVPHLQLQLRRLLQQLRDREDHGRGRRPGPLGRTLRQVGAGPPRRQESRHRTLSWLPHRSRLYRKAVSLERH